MRFASLRIFWTTALSLGLISTGCQSNAAISSSQTPQATAPVSPQTVSPQTVSPQTVSPQLAQSAAPAPHLSASSSHSVSHASPASSAPATPVAATAGGLSYEIVTYTSTVLPGERSYGVSLPPGYSQHPQQRYPVIFLLHGGHGNATDWWQAGKGNALVVLQTLYHEDKLPPSIIITPDGNDKRGSSPYRDPEYIDGPNGKVSTAIGDELVKLVQSRYRTLPAPTYWAIGGLSSGGWGAVNVGLHHPNHFSVLFSHSGYFEDKSGPRNSPLEFIKTLPASVRQGLRIYIDTGTSDPKGDRFLEQARQFHQLLNQLGVANVLHEFPGSHQWSYWHEHLADSLTYVANQFKLAGLPDESPSAHR